MRKTRLDGLDVWFLMKELKMLVNARVSKIFQNDDVFVFQFFVADEGKKLLKITPGFIFLIEEFQAPAFVKPFCRILRNYLTNLSVKNIEQLKTERIIEFLFEGRDAKYYLYVELFDRGNIILCDGSKKIIHPLHSQAKKDRMVKRGELYKIPNPKKSVWDAKNEDFRDIKENISFTLAVELGLGKEYAEEICLRANVDKKKKALTVMEINAILSAIERLKSQKLEPIISEDFALPFKFKLYEDLKSEPVKSFSNGLERSILPPKKPNPFDKKKEKILKIIRMQEEQIENLKKEAESMGTKGELIYHHYALIKDVLDYLNKAKKEFSWSEIKERLKNKSYIKEILEKKQEIVVDL